MAPKLSVAAAVPCRAAPCGAVRCGATTDGLRSLRASHEPHSRTVRHHHPSARAIQYDRFERMADSAWPSVLGLAWLGLAWLGLAWLGLDWIGLAASFACLVCAYVSEEDVERRLAVADEVSVKPSEVRCGGETWDQREWKLGHERRVQPLKVIEPPEDERRLVVQFDGDFVPGMVS